MFLVWALHTAFRVVEIHQLTLKFGCSFCHQARNHPGNLYCVSFHLCLQHQIAVSDYFMNLESKLKEAEVEYRAGKIIIYWSKYFWDTRKTDRKWVSKIKLRRSWGGIWKRICRVSACYVLCLLTWVNIRLSWAEGERYMYINLDWG